MSILGEQDESFTRALAKCLLHEDRVLFTKALAELGDVSDVVFLNLPMSSNGVSFKGVDVPGRNEACLCGNNW
jgi:hypothetical protein